MQLTATTPQGHLHWSLWILPFSIASSKIFCSKSGKLVALAVLGFDILLLVSSASWDITLEHQWCPQGLQRYSMSLPTNISADLFSSHPWVFGWWMSDLLLSDITGRRKCPLDRSDFILSQWLVLKDVCNGFLILLLVTWDNLYYEITNSI